MTILRAKGITARLVKPLLLSGALLVANGCANYGEQMADDEGVVQIIKNDPNYEGAHNFTYSEGAGKSEYLFYFDLPDGRTCNAPTDLNYERLIANPYCAKGNNRPVYCVRTVDDALHGRPETCSEIPGR